MGKIKQQYTCSLMITRTDFEEMHPRAFSHIGLSVPNLEQAVKFIKKLWDGMLLWNHPLLRKK